MMVHIGSDHRAPSSLFGNLRAAYDAPWKLVNRLHSLAVIPAVRAQFTLAGIPWGTGWTFYGMPIIQKHRGSSLTIGPRLSLRSSVRSNPLGPSHPVILSTRRRGSRLEIGSDFAMSGGCIVVQDHVRIGNRVTVGANCIITDTDFHPVDHVERRRSPSAGNTAPVAIEDDVFIGMHCLILRGVTIGATSVIGAGSIVTRSIPPGVVAAGAPARLLRKLSNA